MCQSQLAHQCPPRPSFSSLTALVTAHATGRTSQMCEWNNASQKVQCQICEADNGNVDADMYQLAWNGVHTGLCDTIEGNVEALLGLMLNVTDVQAPGR